MADAPPPYLGKCKSVDSFEKLNRLGEGTYGTVYRARSLETGLVVALKKVRIHNEKDGFPRSSLREIRLLRHLRHPNIVQLLDVCCGQSVYLVFEYCEHDVGALLDLMERPFSQAEVKCLTLQLLTAVEFLHARCIMHRDLKLSNLLLTNKGVLKLADFGLAREFSEPPDPASTLTANVVTLWYRSPELLLGAPKYTTAVDVWSLGCIFGELLHHRPLMPGKSEEDQLRLMCELLGTPNSKIWPGVRDLPLFGRVSLPACGYNNLQVKFPIITDNCLDLLNKFLTFNPDRRATASGSLQHAYFSEAPTPLELQLMPTWREHRNEGANRKPSATRVNECKAVTVKRPLIGPKSGLFPGSKRSKTMIF